MSMLHVLISGSASGLWVACKAGKAGRAPCHRLSLPLSLVASRELNEGEIDSESSGTLESCGSFRRFTMDVDEIRLFEVCWRRFVHRQRIE